MKKRLLIVESPTKAKTVKKFLGEDFSVVSSQGHVRDLPKSKMGVDVEHNFQPEYEISPRKRLVIKKIKEEAKKGSGVVMATDPDREGEAIAWHLSQILRLPEEKVDRIVFHEITKSAIEEALSNPRKIDMNLVDAQQARRILDRLVGYELSPFLWRKVRYGLSAGRVQSVAVRLIVEREREIRAFKAVPFWRMFAYAGREKPSELRRFVLPEKNVKCPHGDIIKELNDSTKLWRFLILKKDGSSTEKDKWNVSKKWVSEKIGSFSDRIVIERVTERERRVYPLPPFITSTLQRAAFLHLGFSTLKTMKLAQQLYEAGLITYIRTDSVKLSEKALSAIRAWIANNMGKEYLPEKPRQYKTVQKLAQEAHEAIRPTDISIEKIDAKFSEDHKKLYLLIRNRALASQVKEAVVNRIIVDAKPVSGDGQPEVETLQAKLDQLVFDGFYRILGVPFFFSKRKDFIPVEGEVLYVDTWAGIEGHTDPPPRYTEASLVKALEKYGIGRPSTYAPIIDTIIKRGYVIRDGSFLAPSDNGSVVNDLLVKHFQDIVDVKFTAKMEDKLDDIAKGEEKWVEVVKRFYGPFKANLEAKEKEVDKKDVTVLGESEEKCPECGSRMVIKISKHGKFLSCSRFPVCKGMKPMGMEIDEEFKKKYENVEKCDKCGAKVILKTGKFGRFWACENYPKCKFTAPLKLLEKCPKCDSALVEKRSNKGRLFIGCSNYPRCRYVKK